MKKKIVMITILLLLVLGGGGAGAYFYYQNSKFISTEDAKVTGDLRAIGSLSAGKLIEWRYKEGDAFSKGDVLGIVETTPARGTIPATTVEITAPEQGTLIQTNAVKDQTVAPGAALAMSADLAQLYVTANLSETDLKDIHVGSRVTIHIDAFEDTTFTGKIDKIGLGTNSSFSLLGSSNTSGNYTKVIQKVQVKIVLDDFQGKRLIPGLNATVKVER
jgi:multidrug resistance efflux pump